MNRKIAVTAIMLMILLTTVPIICSDDSDAASGGTAANSFRLRSGSVSIETTDSYSDSDSTRYCFIAGSEEDDQMKDYLRYGNVPCPTPLGSPVSGETYAIYRLSTGTGSFLSSDILAFTVAENGDVPIKITSTKSVSVSVNRSTLMSDTNIDTVEELKAGDNIIIAPDTNSHDLSFGSYWYYVSYEIGNVVLSESYSLPDAILLYGIAGLTIGLVLLGMIVCRRHPLSRKRDPAKVHRLRFPFGAFVTILVVGVVIAAGVQLYVADEGGKDLRSLDVREGLNFEITSENATSTTRAVITVTDVDENDIVSFNVNVYIGSSTDPTSSWSSSAKKTDFERTYLYYQGSTTDLMRTMERTYSSVDMSKEILDTGFGNMYCDRYVCRDTSDDAKTYTYYFYHGFMVKRVIEDNTGGTTTTTYRTLTSLSYA